MFHIPAHKVAPSVGNTGADKMKALSAFYASRAVILANVRVEK